MLNKCVLVDLEQWFDCLKGVWPIAGPAPGSAAQTADVVSGSLETCPLLCDVGRRGMSGYNDNLRVRRLLIVKALWLNSFSCGQHCVGLLS